MKCPKCGSEIPDTAVFCPICGLKIEQTDLGDTAEAAADQETGEAVEEVNPETDYYRSYENVRTEPAADSAPETAAEAESPFGQAPAQEPNFGNPYGQSFGTPYGQPYGQTGGQGQAYGQAASQGPGFGQAAGQGPAFGQAPGQGQTFGQPGGFAPQPRPVFNPYDHTSDYSPEEISDNKVICMAIYLFPIFGLIIALLADRSVTTENYKTSYVGFNVRQDLKLEVFTVLCSIAAAVVGMVIAIISAINSMNSYYYYGGAGLAAGLTAPFLIISIVGCVMFVVRIICFVNICKGKAIEAPIVRSVKFLR